MSDVFRILQRLTNKLIIIGLVLLFVACSDDFSPNTDVEGVPVVYGIINPADSIYYIRLSKTFQCNTDIAICAHDTGHLYYRDPKVEIEVLNPKGDLLNRGQLYRVTLTNTQNLEGLFDSPVKMVYTIRRDQIMIDSYFDQARILILKISTPEYSRLVYAKSVLRSSLVLLKPKPLIHGTFLDFYSEETENIVWDGWTDDYHEITFTFHYSDHYTDSVNFRSIVFKAHIPPVHNPDLPADRYIYHVFGDWFLKRVAKCFQSISTPDSLQYRKFETIDVEVASITGDFYDYTYSLGFDSDVEIAQKSNIVNGLGVFATKRKTQSTGHYLNFKVLDSLANSPTTRWINFTKWNY